MTHKILQFFRKSTIILLWVGIIFAILFSKNIPNKMNKSEKTLCIFTWSDVFSNEFIKNFEKETGIKVHIDYYSSNEELLIKLKKVRFSGYDLIVPSDYAIPMLTKEGLLKPLKKSKLHFLDDLNPLLLGHEFDPENNFSLPLQWDICGFGIDKDVFKDFDKTLFTWDHLFNNDLINYKIAMTNDPIEAFSIASYYLFGKKTFLTNEEAYKVKELLIKQKNHVEAYAVPRSDYVLGSKNASLAVSLSAYILRSKEYFPFMKFVLPEKSTAISIENIAIPQGDQNDDNIYAFLNFIYRPENLSKSCNDFGVFPATMSATDSLKYKEDFLEIQSKIKEENYELFFCKHLISEKLMRALWIQIKS